MTSAPPLEGRAEGRVPPHDLDAENSVLGAILLDPTAITRVLESLRPEDFYRENNAQVYRAAVALFQAGEPIDNVTLAAALERLGVLERVGGRAQLALLAEAVPTAANVEYYARIVKSKAIKRKLIRAGGEVAAIGFDEGIEADDALNRAEKAVFDVAEERVSSAMARLYELLRPAMDRIDAQMSSGNAVIGVPSGFYDLDNLTSGFKGSDLIVVAGRPAMGKTSFLLNLTLHAAVERQVPVAVFSLEMSKEQLVERLLCQQARIDSQRMHRGMLSEAEYERLVMAIGPLENAPIFIDDSPVLDELSLLLKARQAKLRENIGMIVLDYLQLMTGRSRGDDINRVQEVSSISRSLKALARELHVPLIAVSQLSRAPEARPNKRPMLSDLRECVVGDTRLIDAETGRWIEIRDIQPGARVLSVRHDQTVGCFQVADVWSTGMKPVFTLLTRTRRSVTCTSNHPFLTPTGWRRLAELRPGDSIATALRLPPHGHERPERGALCRLLGYLVGDGSYGRHRGLEFISGDDECLDDVAALVSTHFPTVRVSLQRDRPGVRARELHLTTTFGNGYGKPYGNPLREWLRDLGIFGQRDRDKRVPTWVFEAGAVGAQEFLAGYLAADGCITRSSTMRPSLRFDTVSRGLADDVCALLLRLGVVGVISAAQWNTKSTRPIYRVTVADSNLRCLSSQLPVRGRKRTLLREVGTDRPKATTNPGLFGLPRELSAYVAERTREIAVASGGYGPGKRGIDHGPLWRDQRKRMHRQMASSWASLLDDPVLRSWAASDLLWEEVRSITPAGEAEVFDLRVPGAQNFLANGVVAHNSGSIEQDSDIVLFLYRDEYYNPNTDHAGIAEINVAKHRNGPTDTVKLRFRKDQTLFYNLEARRSEPDPT